MKIGFIGLGIMGKGMANRLLTQLNSSHLVVWNRTATVAEQFANQYPPSRVIVAKTPAEVVRSCDVTISMLSTLQASHDVFHMKNDGVIDAIVPGKTIIDCSTITPQRMMEAEAQVLRRGGRFMDAPVSGSKAPAETGTLIFLCSGDRQVYDSSQMLLNAMGKANFYFGPAGNGSKMKLVINMLMATTMSAFSEGLSLCHESQLPTDEFLKVLELSAIACPMFKAKGPAMLKGKFDPAFPLKHALKDLCFALDMAKESGVSVPTTVSSTQQFQKAHNAGLGNQDFSAVFKVIDTKTDSH